MPVVIACSACQGKMSIPEQYSGKAVKCPRCGETIQTSGGDGAAAAPAVARITPAPAKQAAAATKPAAQPAAAPAPPAPAAETVLVSCGGCQKKLQVKAAYAGKAIKCPGCGQPVKIPAPAAPAAEEEWTEINEEAAPPPAEEPAPAPKRGSGPVGEWGEELLEAQGVPDEMRGEFRSEMTKTERIVWAGRPRVDILLHRARLIAYIAGPICSLVAVIALTVAVICVLNGAWIGLMGVVFGLVFGFGAFFTFRLPGNVTKNADKRACYAITNRRLLLHQGKAAQIHIGSGGAEVAAGGTGLAPVIPYIGLELTRLQRVDAGPRFPDAGDVWIGRTLLEEHIGWGLQAVDKVRDVERAIREKLIHPVIDKLLRGGLLSKEEKGKKASAEKGGGDVIAADSNIKEYGGGKRRAPEIDPNDPNLKAAPGQDLKAIFAAALKKVPAEIRQGVDAEMTAGEKVLWIGRPEAGVKGRGFLGTVTGSAKRYEPDYTHYAITSRRVLLFVRNKAPHSYYTPALLDAGVESDDRIPNGGGLVFRKVKRIITSTDKQGKTSTRVEMHHFGLLRIRNYKAVATFVYDNLIGPCKGL